MALLSMSPVKVLPAATKCRPGIATVAKERSVIKTSGSNSYNYEKTKERRAGLHELQHRERPRAILRYSTTAFHFRALHGGTDGPESV